MILAVESKDVVTVIVASIGAVGGVLAFIQSRSANSRNAKIEEKAALIEGYDEFTLHLREQVADLEKRLRAWQTVADECRVQCSECARDLDEARRHLAAAQQIAAELRSEVDRLRAQFGIDVAERHPDWGRRQTDVELPIDDHPDQGGSRD